MSRPRRRNQSTNTTPSHGPIQYEMISRKFSYFDTLFRPSKATIIPATPKTSATAARAECVGSRMPIAMNEIEPEYTFSAFAAIAPSTTAIKVSLPIHVGSRFVKESGARELCPAVTTAAPATSSSTHDQNTPRPDHHATAVFETSGLR